MKLFRDNSDRSLYWYGRSVRGCTDKLNRWYYTKNACSNISYYLSSLEYSSSEIISAILAKDTWY